MKFAETINGYNAMGRENAEYEACYAVAEHHTISGLHCHDFYEFYIHYQGGKVYYVDGSVFPLQNNQLIIMPPFRMHGLVGGNSLLIDISAQQDMADEMVQFRNYGRIIDFMVMVCQAVQGTTAPIQPSVVNDVIFDVLQYINDHFTEPLKLEDIARRFAISVSYLSHEFTSYAGRSVYEYILYRRVQLAKENLLTDMSLSEVADRSGFGDYSGFLRSFRRMTGMAPNAYRKQRSGGH